ncbi:MAG: hypothetical protein Q4G07_00445 [Oscillospiraceae bacterium]|nr:hypothetical protein [Oscillospiraceae bacterium]
MRERTENSTWHKLDNTANLFPVVSGRRSPNVYRMTAVLKETVDPALLEEAVNVTLPWFPAFGVQLKKGFFWAYFESNPARPRVFEEQEQPCRYIEPRKNRKFLFRVLYFQNRVHLEVFHALTDGMGALSFLKAVCYRYLLLRYPENFSPEQRGAVYGAEGAGDVRDGYLRNYEPAPPKTFKETKALQLRGERFPFGQAAIVNYILDTGELKQKCKGLGATVTQYFTARIAWAIYTGMLCRHAPARPLSIFVPVDLRRMFESETALNFFSNIVVALSFADGADGFEAVLEEVKRQFAQRMDKQDFQARLSYTAGSQRNILIRCTPLVLKNLILNIIYHSNNKGGTMPFSNLGVQKVEPIFAPYFESFRAMLGNSKAEPVTATACTFQQKTVLTISSALEDTSLLREIARGLSGDGLKVEIETNEVLL